jgi:hypothetical protein
MYPFVAGRSQPINDEAKEFVDDVLSKLSIKSRVAAGLQEAPPPKDKDDDDNSDKEGMGSGADGNHPHTIYL